MLHFILHRWKTSNWARTPRSHKSILPYSHCARVLRSIMIWGLFCCHGIDTLVLLEGIQTAMAYLDIQADQAHLAMLYFYLEVDVYFMDDNAAIHRTRSVQNWFTELQSEFKHLSRPPHSPDFNPIENVSDMVKRHNRHHSPLTSNLQDLKSLRVFFSSDEAHFWLNGYVNKQNCRTWSEANPQVYVETPLHPEKLTVWCALWAGGIIGPYFFKNDEGHNVTVNDGATCHTARATIDLLKDTFGDRLISRFGPVNWPPRSCDLTPLDYFLWGYVKSLVYADKPQTLDHLEDNIRRVIADIRPQMLEKVIENWTSRLDYIRASRGSPMPEIIFKM
ncbi:uncharacterized protein TNCV_2462511 [Trichonephila clavipes]|nr:uncharacterized protein TNCV_2462511 [Trichonephila clavipes]